MEFKDKIKEIKIEFSGDALEMYDKLNFIMCTSRYKYLNIDDPPNETTLLFNLLYSDAMYIREVYYTPSIEFSKEVKDKAKIYADYLNRRKIGFTFQECVKYFFNYEIEKSLSDRAALYYPDFKAFVRCGDIDPKQLFELLAKEHCDRVIISTEYALI